jgi:hypothetical protein
MIGSYLAETRLLSREQPDKGTEAYYTLMVQFCNKIIKSFTNSDGGETAALVIVTYSAQRKCELVEIGKDRILIFDKNLGQALNTLNRILFFSKKSISAYRPLLRYITDEAILLGRNDLASFFAAKTVVYEKFWDLPGAASRPDVWHQTYLQELFIFAHEYCHLIGSNNKVFKESRARAGKLLLEPEDIDPAKLHSAYMKRYKDGPSLAELTKIHTEFESDLKASEADLVDELGCDDFAVHVLIEYCKSYRIPLVDCFNAAFLAMRHARAINYARAFIRQLAGRAEPSGQDRRVRLLQHRQHRLRTAFPWIIKLLKSDPLGAPTLEDVTASSLDADISNLSDLHDQKIDNVLLFELIPNLADEFARWKKKYKVSSQTNLTQSVLVASAVGWSYGLENPTYVSFPKGLHA